MALVADYEGCPRIICRQELGLAPKLSNSGAKFEGLISATPGGRHVYIGPKKILHVGERTSIGLSGGVCLLGTICIHAPCPLCKEILRRACCL